MTQTHRIAALPRRNWRDLEEESVRELTAVLRTPDGKQVLRGLQAVGLREAAEYGGAFIIGRTGVGKTLMTLLLGEWMGEERVLIVVPQGHKAKAEDEFEAYRKDWKGKLDYKLFGFGDISKWPKDDMGIHKLWGGQGPTLIIVDEADKLRRVDPKKGASGIALQFNDWMVAHPECKMVALTATPEKSSICDYAHVLQWCLRDGSPLPTNWEDLFDWSEVIDKGNMHSAGKVCRQLGIEPTENLAAIRAAYAARLRETPGVLVSDDLFDGPLSFKCEVLHPPPEMLPLWHKLRKKWQRPDGWDLSPELPPEGEERKPDRVAAGTIWGVARCMGLGFCYVPDPMPPEEWLEKRRCYFRVVRKLIRKRQFYTENQIHQAAAGGRLKPADQKAWQEWQEMRPTFEPGYKPLWLSNHAIERCIEWGRQGPGIIWVDHIAFGLELERQTGWPFYGEGGKNRYGIRIENAPQNSVVIASRLANQTGRNLQYTWHRNLVVAMPGNNRDFEQMVARTHRDGQEQPVTVEILLSCMEHFDSLDKVLDEAEKHDQTLLKQKATHFPWQHVEVYPKGLAFNDN